MKTLLSLTCLLLACQAIRAGDSKADAAAAKAAIAAAKAGTAIATKPGSGTADATAVKSYTPTHKSVFIASAKDHNPFWPIGWVKIENSSADSEAPVIPHAEDFSVTSILLNEPPMAVINGKEMAEGEIAAIPLNGQSVMVQLMAVQDGRVILRWENQNLVILLHRQEEFSQATVPQ